MTPRPPASRSEIALLGAAAIVTCWSLALAVARPETWARAGHEDGVVEMATAVAFLGLSVLAARRFLRSPAGARLPSALVVLLGIFGAGEEISWGQRMFHLRPPEFFATHNVQHEMNLHNLLPPPWDALLAAVLFLAFCSTPLWRDHAWARALQRRGVPWPRPLHINVMLACVAAALAVGLATRAPELEELGELLFVLIVSAVWCSGAPGPADASL